MRRRIVAITVALLVATAASVGLVVTRAQARVPLRITRIFTGTDGLAHVERLDTTFARPQSQPTLGWLESYQVGLTSGNAIILRHLRTTSRRRDLAAVVANTSSCYRADGNWKSRTERRSLWVREKSFS